MEKTRLRGYGRYAAAFLLALSLLAPALSFAAPYLFKDLNPGSAGSSPANLTNVNGTLFFTTGQTLWKSDGTDAGTVIVKNLPAATPAAFTNAAGTLFFTLNNGNELWKSDGTDAGTVLVSGVKPRDMKAVGSAIFFKVNDPAYGTELWRSDGTQAGTVMVKDINPGSASAFPTWDAVRDISEMGGICYFNATDGVNGYQLWRSDGTDAGTWAVKSGGCYFPVWQTILGGTFYCYASDSLSGTELWKSDGTESGTAIVKDINPGASSCDLYSMAACGGKLYFRATDGVYGHELWKSDGTSAGTVMVKDSIPGSEPTYAMGGPNWLTDVNGTLFYEGGDLRLWKSDGTDAGTVIVKTGVSNPSYLTNVNGVLYFDASNVLWKSDGTDAGTVQVTAISHNSLTVVNGRLFFAANDGISGWELWSVDSRPASAVTSPLSGSAVKGAGYTITGTATDYAGSGIQKVEVSTDGGATWNLASGTTSWTYDWALPADGSYTVKSRATDNANNAESPGPGVTVTVDNISPTSSVTAPANAALLSGVSYTITGTASDGIGYGVRYVDVSIDGGKTWRRATGTTSWKYTWSLPASGNWHIISRATDKAGNVEKPGAGVIVTITTPSVSLWAWGYNGYGQLGDGTQIQKKMPVIVSGLSDVTAIAAGSDHTVALKSDGTVWAWGDNSYGQLGDGTTTLRNTPVQVSGLTGVLAIACGWRHNLALKSDGTVWAWGDNDYGKLGDGTTTQRNAPVQLSGLTGIVAISGGLYHTTALKYDGTVWTWGGNGSGQLGDGTTTQRNTAVQVSGLTGVMAVASGSYHTIALKSDGTVWAWGGGTVGQLGDGTATQENTPVQTSGLAGVMSIAAGSVHNLALKSDGTVWAWGDNWYGQLGDGTTTQRHTPVQVPGLTAVTSIACGQLHSIALKSDGTVWTWGDNGSGELGDGTVTQRTTPVLSLGLTGVTAAVAGGGYHTMALKKGSFGGGSPELPHYSWNAAMIPGGTDCTTCHAAPGTFTTATTINTTGFCYTCHNTAANAHSLGLYKSQHPLFVNATATGRRKPVFGSITAGETNDVPVSRLQNGKAITCATCHNSMRKTDDPGRSWEYTTTSDRYKYYLQNGGWTANGNLTPKVYRDSSLWSGPTYSKDRKDYLVDPAEYTYNEYSGFIRFKAQQASTSYIYATLYYPYLRAPMQDNALCSDCHTQATHKDINCLNCHQAHNTGNVKGIRENVRATNYTSVPVRFLRYTGMNSFADGGSARDGICVVCHTATMYYRRDGTGFANHSGGNNYDGRDCTACHRHNTGFGL